MIKRLAGVLTIAILCVPLAAAPSQAWSWHPARYPHRLVGTGTASRSARLGLPPLRASIGAAPPASGGHATIGTLPRVLVGSAPQDAAFDPATHTVYVANAGDNTLSVVNALTCNSRDLAGCDQRPAAVAAGPGANAVAVDVATHTVYVTDGGSDTVSVINAATCNAQNRSGCGHKPATVTVGRGPIGLVVDPATDTIYVTNLGSGDTVSVIDGATCNASNTSGCRQKPATVTVGQGPFNAAFDAATRTVYVTNQLGHSVSMINARICNATATSGCGQKIPAVAVGASPIPVTVDPRTDTVYVGNNGDGTVSVINARTCNATRTSGCGHPAGMLKVPGGPLGLTVNDATRTLFVSNDSTATGALGPGSSPRRSDSVSVINAAPATLRTRRAALSGPPPR